MGYFGLYHVCEESKVSLLEQAALKTKDHPWILKRLLTAYSEEGHNLEALQRAQTLVYKLVDLRIFDKEERNAALATILWRQALYYQKKHDTTRALDLVKQSHGMDSSLPGPVIYLSEHETPLKAQKLLIRACHKAGHPEITAAALKILPGTVETFHAFEEALSTSTDREVQFLLAKLAEKAQLLGRAKQILSAISTDAYDTRHYILSATLHT
jgi:uncharacterized membrane-anchored protein